MDVLRRIAIYSTIWTLICSHAVYDTYFNKYLTKLQNKAGIAEEISSAGTFAVKQDAYSIQEENELVEHDDVFRTIKKMRRQAGSGDKKVAFFATLSTGATGLGNGQTIPFDRTTFDEGNAFDFMFHAFICPVNGIYLFRSSLMSEKYSHIETEVVKDGSPIFRMYASGGKSSFNYDQGFNSGIINCDINEKVWVRVNGNLGTAALHRLFTTFSGYLIWEIDASRHVVNTSANSTNVAFHSYLSRNVDNVWSHQTIPFEKVLTNEGQGYDNKNYIFTCPLNGLYMFQSSVFSNYGPIETELVKDGKQFARMYAGASGTSSYQHDQGFNAGIIHCSKDQKVWVRVNQGKYVMEYMFTTFSGYLMWETENVSASHEMIGRAINAEHTHVAFHSFLSAAVEELGKEQTIQFDKTSLNEGNGFDPGFHTFICPVSGVYVFQSSLMVTASEIETEIVKDSSTFARIFAGVDNHGGHFDQGFNSGIVICNNNDRIWVRTAHQSGASVYHYNWTTFSGFLLWEI